MAAWADWADASSRGKSVGNALLKDSGKLCKHYVEHRKGPKNFSGASNPFPGP